VQKIADSGDIPLMRHLISQLEDDKANLESHVDYLRVVINGSWPEADKIIQSARHKKGNA
jgi:hypothetical protein